MRAPVTPAFKRLAAQGYRESGPDIVAERHGAQEMRSNDAESLSSRESSGHHCAPGMRLRRRVRIVGFIRMSQHPIDECRFDWLPHNNRCVAGGYLCTTATRAG